LTLARTYLDYNASAPLRPDAKDAMLAALDVCGNPSSVHAEGRRVRGLIEAAREEVAALAGARPSEIVFTSGATEANAWAVSSGWDVIALSAIEHDSVRVPAEKSGAQLIGLAVAPTGVAESLGAVDGLAEGCNGLAVMMTANNETGVVQDVGAASEAAKLSGFSLHIDAVQAAGRIAIDFEGSGATTLSLSAHKIGGPKGTGALVIRDGVSLPSLIAGGGQERRRRAGTENVAAIAGFGAAARASVCELGEMARVRQQRDRLEREVLAITPDAVIAGHSVARLANTSCIALPGASAETLVIKLDLAGIAVSAGAACSSGKVGESHVLNAMGFGPGVARSAIRVSIGTETSDEDIDSFLREWAVIGRAGRIAA
jgi:cysteine desulfurase